MLETEVVTGRVRFSYVHVFTAKAMSEGDTPKYSVSLLIPKTDEVTIAKIKTAIKTALEEGKSKFGGKIPKIWKNPIRDGDKEREDNEEYQGCFFLNANSTRKPALLDDNREEIIDPEAFYSGCYGRAHINFYAFDVKGNKGVACGLNGLQKQEEGERLGGSITSSVEAFGEDVEDLMG